MKRNFGKKAPRAERDYWKGLGGWAMEGQRWRVIEDGVVRSRLARPRRGKEKYGRPRRRRDLHHGTLTQGKIGVSAVREGTLETGATLILYTR